jgi:hypothetical protein
MKYKLINKPNGELSCIKIIGQETAIPLNPANTDYQAYLAWLDEGNEPLPPDEAE